MESLVRGIGIVPDLLAGTSVNGIDVIGESEIDNAVDY
jgi:hypothetical protein